MGSIWLHGGTPGYPNLLDVLRAAGVSCSGYDGWTTRSRSSGGFASLMVVYHHHTASNTSPDRDLDYMVNGPDNPISNGLLDRTGHFTAIAAGASNHAGKGGGSDSRPPWHSSKGPVPTDSGNSNGFGIECANAGTGEPYSNAQQDAYAKMSRALCDAYGLVPSSDLLSHFEWTDRKCDPTGASRWTPPGNRQGCAGADRWDMNLYRAEIAGTTPGPRPPEEDVVTDEDIQKITANVTEAIVAQFPYIWEVTLPAAYGVGPAPARAWLSDTRVVVGQINDAVNVGGEPVVTDESS